MKPDLYAFQEIQHALAQHLRGPGQYPRPAGLPARRVGLYRELLFNNLCGFLDSCFPVSRTLLGARRWRRLNRQFYRDWPHDTPWFREIPAAFVRYLAQGVRPDLPAWLPALAHYEWVELALDTHPDEAPAHKACGDLLEEVLVLNPAAWGLEYDWPVHRIGPDYRPRKPRSCHLLVFRDRADRVQFRELNPLTAQLFAVLQAEGGRGCQAVIRLAAALGHTTPDALMPHAAALFQQWLHEGIILGVQA